MRIKCSNCGKDVSTEVPEGTIIRAWVECPVCAADVPNELCYEGPENLEERQKFDVGTKIEIKGIKTENEIVVDSWKDVRVLEEQ